MPLKTEKRSNASRALKAFRAQLGYYGIGIACVFEHGQLWIVDNRNGAQWSVVDATGGQSVNGFDFEQISEGIE